MIKDEEKMEKIEIGSWCEYPITDRCELYVVSYGSDVDAVISKAQVNHLNLNVVNARFFKPLDTIMLDHMAASHLPIIVYETDILAGGLSSAMLEYYNDTQQTVPLIRIGIDDHYVAQGSISELRKSEKIDLNSLFEKIGELLHEA